MLASVVGNNVVRLWDTVNGELLSTFIGDERVVRAIAFSPDGSLFASGGLDAFLLWDVGRRRKLATSQGEHGVIRTLAFSLDGKTLVSGCYGGKVQLWMSPLLLTL